MNRRRTLPLIAENLETLQVFQHKLRSDTRTTGAAAVLKFQKLHALCLIVQGQVWNKSDLATVLGVPRRTVGDWLQRYETGGLSLLLNRNYSGPAGRPARLPRTGAVAEYIDARLTDPTQSPTTWIALWEDVEREFNVGMNFSGFYQAVKKRYPGAGPKVARPRHYRQEPGAVEAFKKTPVSAENSPTETSQ
jgi:transposase